MEDKLSIVVSDTGIELAKAKSIWVQFEGSFEAINACAEKVEGLEITDISQRDDMRLARETRLELKRIRVDAEKKKKELKDGILKEGRFIDATLKLITDATKPVEANLLEMESFAKRKEEERLAQLKQDRIAELSPYDVDTQFIDVVNLTEDEFAQLVEKSQRIHEEHLAQKKREEEERLEQERLEAEERIVREKEEADRRAKAEAEIERIRKEQEERERDLKLQLAEEKAKADAARKEAEEAARKEREAREELERKERERQAEELRKMQEGKARIERELREKQEAEERARREEDERRIKLEQADDKEKISAYLNSIIDIKVPTVESPAAKKIIDELRYAIQEATTDMEML